MSERKLNYKFINPNTESDTASYILKIFIEANKEKVDKVIKKEIKSEDDD